MPLFRHFQLLSADEYAHDLKKSIQAARTDIALTVTTLRADDERSRAIIDALCDAADRGVAVSVCADTVTYLEPKEFLLSAPRRHPARAIQAVKLERRLKSHGITFHWLGRKTNVILSGRTHSKWAVVDKVVYAFGGVNLDRESFDNVDFMIKINNAPLAAAIIAEHVRIRRADRGGGAIRSHTMSIDDHTTVLFDGGLPMDSIIYRRALSLARRATDTLVVSQYCPTGRLGKYLKRRRARLYYNHWRHASFFNKLLIRQGMLVARSATGYQREGYLHAKFMIATMPDGSRVAITGSHNFMFGSGLLGTREIALETTDARTIDALEKFFHQYIA